VPPRRLTRSFLRKDLDRRAARGEPSPRSPSYPSAWLARRGRLEGAEQLAREGVKVAANSEFVVLHADVLLDLAEVLELAGRPEGHARRLSRP
jgi:hypothetical protein